MKKRSLLFSLALMFLSAKTFSQAVVAGRMNEVFLKTNLSTTGLTTPWEITYGPDGYLWVTDAKAYKVYRMDPVTGTKTLILDLSETSTFTPSSFRRTFTGSQNPWPQGGLAGLAIHPDFMNVSTPKKYVYISYVRKYDSASATMNGGYFFKNSVVRFNYNTGTGLLDNPVALCDTIPGSSDHNSQRLIIIPVAGTSYLFYGAGDMGAGQLSSAKRLNHAQEIDYYQGKILRFNLEADADAGAFDQWIPNDNPFNTSTQSAIWCLGVRNNQGFAYDSVRNILYGSSHGPYSDDEVNVIEPSRNYGHPLVIGYAADNNYNGSSAGAYPASNSSLAVIVNETTAAAAIGASYKDPLLSAYPTTQSNINTIWTTAPGNNGWPSEAWSGLGLYNYSIIPDWKNSLLMAGLKWGRVIRTKLDNTGIATLPSGTMADTVIYFDGTPRIRDMAFGPDGKDIYIVTDNSNSGNAPTGTNNPLLPSCLGCVQKFTFLGYNTVAGTSAIPNTVSIAAGKPNICEDANTITIDANNTNLWVPITDTSGNVVAEIKANGNIMGTVTTSLFSNATGSVREFAGSKALYLDRNITITPQTQPSSAVSIRLYLNNTEFTAIKNAVNSQSQPSGVNSITNLSIFKNADVCSPGITNAAALISTTNQSAFGAGGYVMQADVNSFSTFYMASVTSLLPVHSLSFNGTLVNNIGQLRWVTEDEQGTKSFTVERSTNSRDFYPVDVQLASSATGKSLYAFSDSSVAQLSTNILYYRLKLTGAEGKSSYSSVIILNLGEGKPAISVHPNPVLNSVTINIDATVPEKANWQLTDITGKTVMQRPVTLSRGNNEMKINISSLPAGTYYLKVTGNNISQSVKLQKL
ncbi:MAG: PQQ-dependent sugar dehydrogenase [Bacteroidota bacterium]